MFEKVCWFAPRCKQSYVWSTRYTYLIYNNSIIDDIDKHYIVYELRLGIFIQQRATKAYRSFIWLDM